MNKQTEDRIKRIAELLRQKETIDKQLEELVTPKTVTAPPVNFDFNHEIMAAIEEESDGISSDGIFKKLQLKWPDVDRAKMNSAIVYLANRKRSIERAGRGIYRLPSAAQSMSDVSSGEIRS